MSITDTIAQSYFSQKGNKDWRAGNEPSSEMNECLSQKNPTVLNSDQAETLNTNMVN